MDSLTHAVIGACLGEAIAGKKLGKKAMLIGALANNFPDIDVITSLWTDPVNELLVHRGITHSILFVTLATPFFAWGFNKVLKNNTLSFRGWLWLIGSGLFLHILMDAFTSYGTGWFEPFSHYRVTFNTLFILDPLFALPLIISTISLIVLKKEAIQKRKWINGIALSLSLVYLLLALLLKQKVDAVIEKDLVFQKIPHQEFMATPAPLSSFLWYSVAKSNNDFYIGYYSVFDKHPTLHWEFFAKQDSLLGKLKSTEEIKLLKRFSKEYYCIRRQDTSLVFNDMRFGQIGGWHTPQAAFVFNFNLYLKEQDKLHLQQGRFKSFQRRELKRLLERIKGDKE